MWDTGRPLPFRRRSPHVHQTAVEPTLDGLGEAKDDVAAPRGKRDSTSI